MRKMAVLLLVALCLSGAGCFGQKKSLESPIDPKEPDTRQIGLKPTPRQMPVLNILKPGLNATTDLSQIHLIGTTNMREVYMGKKAYRVEDGSFDILMKLNKGRNLAELSAGDGTVTSTIHAIINRSNRPLAIRSDQL